MFGIDFSEIIVIAVVALVVLGPERLPRVARMAGHLLGRFRRYANEVKSSIDKEMQLEDIRKFTAEMEQTAQIVETSVSKEIKQLKSVQESVHAAVVTHDATQRSTQGTIDPR